MSFEKHLIAIDLDHTALDNLYELNDITTEVLKELSALGHKVVIATARPSSMTVKHYNKIGLDTLATLCNGADLVDIKEGKHIRKEYIPFDLFTSILDILPRENIINMGIERNDDLYVFGDMMGSEYHLKLERRSNSIYFDLDNIPKLDVGRLFVRISDIDKALEAIEKLEAMEDLNLYYRKNYGSRYYEDSVEHIYVSITSAYADKWYGVKETAKIYGVKEENIITFGDEYNDRMMLKSAKRGFVMKNGNDELKKEIGLVTEHINTDGGVGLELKRIFNL